MDTQRTKQPGEHPGVSEDLYAAKVYAESIVETIHEPLLVLTPELRVKSANPAFFEHFAVNPDETLGRRIYELGNGQWNIPALRSLLEDVLPDSNVFSDFEVRHHFRDIGPRVMLVNARRLDHVQLILLGIRDVTEQTVAAEALRESEERLRLFGEAASDVLWVRNATNLKWEYVSPVFESVYGRGREAILAGDNLNGWAELIVPEDREAALAATERVRSGERLTFEYRIRRPDGEIRWIRDTDFPIHDMDGSIRRIAGIGQDVTEEKRVAEALRALNDSLERHVKERTNELAEANEALHEEARQRRQAEAARAEVLRQLVGAEEAERRRISRELHDSIGQLATGLILGLRRLEREPTDVSRLRDLEALAERIARELQHMAVELRPPALDNFGLAAALRNHLEEWGARFGIEVDFHAGGLDGERLSSEVETTVYRVLQEALSNVLKHAEATRVSVLLERQAHRLTAILEDNGRGFDVDETLKRPEKARRLGVRGIRERVALLGGDMEIESTLESGTTLFIRLPIPTPSAGERVED